MIDAANLFIPLRDIQAAAVCLREAHVSAAAVGLLSFAYVRFGAGCDEPQVRLCDYDPAWFDHCKTIGALRRQMEREFPEVMGKKHG